MVARQLNVAWLNGVLWLCRLVVFFGIYLGIVNNQSLDRGVRFNALQAVLLDIILMCVSSSASVLSLLVVVSSGWHVAYCSI